jgi:hypothetical protein
MLGPQGARTTGLHDAHGTHASTSVAATGPLVLAGRRTPVRKRKLHDIQRIAQREEIVGHRGKFDRTLVLELVLCQGGQGRTGRLRSNVLALCSVKSPWQLNQVFAARSRGSDQPGPNCMQG